MIVDDEVLIADTLAVIFEMAGYCGKVAYSAETTMALALSCSPSLALVDVFLPGMDGIALAHWLKRECPKCPIVLISGQPAAAEMLEAEERQGHHWMALPKPIAPEHLLGIAAGLLQ